LFFIQVFVVEKIVNFLSFRTKFYYVHLSLPPSGGRAGDGGFDAEELGMGALIRKEIGFSVFLFFIQVFVVKKIVNFLSFRT